jgi:hypothetical protein
MIPRMDHGKSRMTTIAVMYIELLLARLWRSDRGSVAAGPPPWQRHLDRILD